MNKKLVKKQFGPSFGDKVVEAALAIPEGRVSTYGHISRAAGGTAPMQARAVTGILAKAAKSGVEGIPFHRIVYADGTVWRKSGYDDARMKLYLQEGIEVDPKGRIANFRDLLYTFD